MVHFPSKHVLENLKKYYQGKNSIENEMKTRKRKKIYKSSACYDTSSWVSNYYKVVIVFCTIAKIMIDYQWKKSLCHQDNYVNLFSSTTTTKGYQNMKR